MAITPDIDPAEERDACIADRWHDDRADREAWQLEHKAMMEADYLLTIITLCSDQQFGQDAVEYAVISGMVKLTGDREKDLRAIMGEPGQPELGQYDAICAAYRVECNRTEALLVQTYEQSGLFAEIRRLPKAA